MTLPMVVTIDGPAGAGKSTVAKALAKRLGISFLDTGAMYRALTVKALRKKLNLEHEEALVKLAQETAIDLVAEPGKPLKVFLDNEDVSEAIRTQEVTNNTYFIARTPGVRDVMVKWQRLLGQKRSLVGDGRDLGTVVFPNAPYKFYLDADAKIRCKRRADELRAKGQTVDEVALAKDLAERDRHDFTRKVGPLKQADDAVYVDSTGMSVDQVVEFIVKSMQAKQRAEGSWWHRYEGRVKKVAQVLLDDIWLPFAIVFAFLLLLPGGRSATLSYGGREMYYVFSKLTTMFNGRPRLSFVLCWIVLLLAVGVYHVIRRSWWRGVVHVLLIAWLVWFIGHPAAEVRKRATLKEYKQRLPQVARENLGRISNRLEEYRRQKGAYPPSLDEVCDSALRPLCCNQSLWTGGPFDYEWQAWGRGYKLRAAGEDAKLGTEDDIVW